MNEIILLFRRLCGMTSEAKPSEFVPMLWAMDKRNPQKRFSNTYDEWFLDHVEDFCNDTDALTMINHWKYVADMYLSHLRAIDKNLVLQQRLISVYYNEMLKSYLVCYNRLLCTYLQYWDFLPEIKDVICNGVEHKEVRRIYKLFRHRAVNELVLS